LKKVTENAYYWFEETFLGFRSGIETLERRA